MGKPRQPFPIALENFHGLQHSEKVYQHGAELNARTDSISIGGISAGGHISAVTQQRARDANIPLKLGKSDSYRQSSTQRLGQANILIRSRPGRPCNKLESQYDQGE